MTLICGFIIERPSGKIDAWTVPVTFHEDLPSTPAEMKEFIYRVNEPVENANVLDCYLICDKDLTIHYGFGSTPDEMEQAFDVAVNCETPIDILKAN